MVSLDLRQSGTSLQLNSLLKTNIQYPMNFWRKQLPLVKFLGRIDLSFSDNLLFKWFTPNVGFNSESTGGFSHFQKNVSKTILEL